MKFCIDKKWEGYLSISSILLKLILAKEMDTDSNKSNSEISTCFNDPFSGSYNLFKYILKKYNLYDSDVYSFLGSNNYSVKVNQNCMDRYGVSSKTWNLLHKDLVIRSNYDEGRFKSLHELKEEYQLTLVDGFKEDEINITFKGSYALLKYIIEKYGLYDSQVTKFITNNCYGISVSSSWRSKEVPCRVWNLIHKDLIIYGMSGKDVKTLEKLQEEFENIKPD